MQWSINDAVLLTMFPDYVFKMAYNLSEKTQRRFFESFVNLGAQVQKELAAGTHWTETSRFEVMPAQPFEVPFFRCWAELRRGKLGLYVLTPVELMRRVNNDQKVQSAADDWRRHWSTNKDGGAFWMLVTATFKYEVLPPCGVPISSLRTQLEPFNVQVGSTQVCIVPVIDEMSYTKPFTDADHNEIGERQAHYHTLHFLKAMVSQDVDVVPGKLFDRSQFEAPAMEALRDTVRWVRRVTGIPAIDVHVGVVESEYRDDAG